MAGVAEERVAIEIDFGQEPAAAPATEVQPATEQAAGVQRAAGDAVRELDFDSHPAAGDEGVTAEVVANPVAEFAMPLDIEAAKRSELIRALYDEMPAEWRAQLATAGG